MYRTTVTLEPDVEALLARVMAERGISFNEALNEAVRDGLSRAPRPNYAFPTFAMGAPRMDLTHASGLAAQLQDEDGRRT